MHLINREWGSNFHFSEGTHKSKGLLTLFCANGNFKEKSQVKTTDRFIVSKIKVEDYSMIIINVYAPCIISEKFKFLDDISVYVTSNIQEENVVILGDFNMVADNVLDIIAGDKHNEKVVKKFNDFKTQLFLSDVWRQSNGRKKEFSWSRKTPFTA